MAAYHAPPPSPTNDSNQQATLSPFQQLPPRSDRSRYQTRVAQRRVSGRLVFEQGRSLSGIGGEAAKIVEDEPAKIGQARRIGMRLKPSQRRIFDKPSQQVELARAHPLIKQVIRVSVSHQFDQASVRRRGFDKRSRRIIAPLVKNVQSS